MDMMFADSWIASATNLSATDAKRAWEFCLKLRENPAHPSLSLERITKAKDKHLWSGRINQGLRAIMHHDGDRRILLYAGQHDDAYTWAHTHTLELNAVTGVLQIVTAPTEVEGRLPDRSPRSVGLFDEHQDAYLLSLGLPPNWLPTIRKITTDDQLDSVLSDLPEEVADRLYRLALGELVAPPAPVATAQSPLESPDTRRRFFALEGETELRTLLEAPLSTWLVFLHPSQRRLADGTFNGPLKITGSAGTGKTVVALHRARRLAAQGKRVLLTSHVSTLCEILKSNARLLCSPDEFDRITVTTVDSMALSLLRDAGAWAEPVNDDDMRALLRDTARRTGCSFVDCREKVSTILG